MLLKNAKKEVSLYNSRDAAIIALLKQNKSCNAISKILGVCWHTVNTVKKKITSPIDKTKTLIIALNKQGSSHSEIERIVGIDKTIVRKIIKQTQDAELATIIASIPTPISKQLPKKSEKKQRSRDEICEEFSKSFEQFSVDRIKHAAAKVRKETYVKTTKTVKLHKETFSKNAITAEFIRERNAKIIHMRFVELKTIEYIAEQTNITRNYLLKILKKYKEENKEHAAIIEAKQNAKNTELVLRNDKIIHMRYVEKRSLSYIANTVNLDASYVSRIINKEKQKQGLDTISLKKEPKHPERNAKIIHMYSVEGRVIQQIAIRLSLHRNIVDRVVKKYHKDNLKISVE